MKKSLKLSTIIAFGGIGLLVVTFLTFLLIPPVIVYTGKYNIYENISDIESGSSGIVFGAGVTPEKEPTRMLQERLETAAELFNNGKIDTIIVSGDNRTSHYNEPEVMSQYLIAQGIPESAIILDVAGLRTYDTCYRAKEVFDLDSALLITHGYHLPRALYLCETFGIESTGFSASKRSTYPAETFYKIREIAALYRSFLDVVLFKPIPSLETETK